MMKSSFAVGCLALLLVFVGCQTTSSEPSMMPRVLIEVPASTGTKRSEMVPVTMPDGSITPVVVSVYPLLTHKEIHRADVVEVELGTAIMLSLTTHGRNKLFQSTGLNMSRRLLLLAGDEVIGMRRIEVPLNDSQYFTFALVPDNQVASYVEGMNRALDKVD